MFETLTWRQTVCGAWGAVHQLSGAHRHALDIPLLHLLRKIRVGEQTDDDISLLNATSGRVSDAVWDEHTQVRATNEAVNAVNELRMAALPSDPVEFVASDELLVTHPARQRYALSNLECMVPATTVMKLGARVISTRRIGSIPAGTQGTVAGVVAGIHVICEFGGQHVCVRPHTFDMTENCGERLATRKQIPLVLGWAVTVHRCQGLSLDTLAVDFSYLQWKKEGLVYWCLSRCRALRGLLVGGLRHELIVVSARAIGFYVSLL